jgi:hypothetical protein
VTGFIWADDSVSPNAAVFASVQPASGKGSIVTPLDTIPVVPVPVSAIRDTSFLFTATAPSIPTDTLSSGLISAPFGLTLQGAGNTPIQKYVVSFDTLSSPPPRNSDVGPTVRLMSAFSTTDSSYAITDAAGRATIRLRLRASAANSSLLLGTLDSAMVLMHVRYHGSDVPVTPPGPIVIRIRIQAK